MSTTLKIVTIYLKSGNKMILDKVEECDIQHNNDGKGITGITWNQSKDAENILFVPTLKIDQIEAITLKLEKSNGRANRKTKA
jgi:hypothetical protein